MYVLFCKLKRKIDEKEEKKGVYTFRYYFKLGEKNKDKEKRKEGVEKSRGRGKKKRDESSNQFKYKKIIKKDFDEIMNFNQIIKETLKALVFLSQDT